MKGGGWGGMILIKFKQEKYFSIDSSLRYTLLDFAFFQGAVFSSMTTVNCLGKRTLTPPSGDLPYHKICSEKGQKKVNRALKKDC